MLLTILPHLWDIEPQLEAGLEPTNLINIMGTNPTVSPPANTFPGPVAVNGNNGEDVYALHPAGGTS